MSTVYVLFIKANSVVSSMKRIPGGAYHSAAGGPPRKKKGNMAGRRGNNSGFCIVIIKIL